MGQNLSNTTCQNDQSKDKQCQARRPVAATDKGRPANRILTAKVILKPDISDKPHIHPDPNTDSRVSVKTDIENNADTEQILIYDANYSGFDDKFASSILYANQLKVGLDNGGIDTEIHKKWRRSHHLPLGSFLLMNS